MDNRDNRVNPTSPLSEFFGERRFTLFPLKAKSRRVSDKEAEDILAQEGCGDPKRVIEMARTLGGEVYSKTERVFLDIQG